MKTIREDIIENHTFIEAYIIKFNNGWIKHVYIYHTDTRAIHVEIYDEYGWMKHHNEYVLK